MTADEFEKGMAVLINGVGRGMPSDQVDVWREMLIDLDFESFKRGVVAVLRDYRFAGFPPIGIIRQAAGAASGIVDADSAGLLAWDRVLRSIKSDGAYKSIQWDDPAIPSAIETAAGTWADLCLKTTEELHTWTKKTFVEAYRAHRAARTAGDGVSPGLIHADAGRIGFPKPEPVRPGDEPKRLYGFDGDTEPKRLPEPAQETLALPSPEDAEPDEPADVRRERLMREFEERFPKLKV